MKKILLYIKQPINKKDLKKVILTGLLWFFICSVGFGSLNALLAYLSFKGTNTLYVFNSLFGLLTSYILSSRIIRNHSIGHIIYKFIACFYLLLYYLLSLFIYYYVLYVALGGGFFPPHIIFPIVFYHILAELTFWNYFISFNVYMIMNLINYILGIVIFVLAFKRVFQHSSFAYLS
ncbi:MAG: hypothetical protein LBV51_05525 [Acholeplasmatales bacterium]|jgi:hypothetical protein|nr:hypothetical protein [Acholeplasmatales bacterium]